MFRPRTALAATLLSGAVVGGSALAAGPAFAAADGLTVAQAKKARAAALKQVPGRVIEIDRDRGATRYEVTVITTANRARDVELDAGYRVVRTTRGDRNGLTYRTAGRASRAVLGRIKGIVIDLEAEREGAVRYEGQVLTSGNRARKLSLDAGFRVVPNRADD